MTPSEIKPGMRFGHWTVIKFDHTNKHRIKYFLCRCDCGTERAVRGTALVQGTSTACCRQCDNNLIGQRFGKLLVISRDKESPQNWICKCDCGNTKSVRGASLRAGGVKSCGCLSRSPTGVNKTTKEMSKKYKDAIGKKFGKLTVLKSKNDQYYMCKCDCGKMVDVYKYSIISGNTTSCGCQRAQTYLANKKQEYEKMVGQKVNMLTIKKCYYKNNTFWFDCKCDCGKDFTAQAMKIASKYYYSCGCVKSHAEEEFEKILQKYNIIYKREYKIPNCRDKQPLPFDFAIFNQFDELIGLVELNGKQHYSIGGWSTKERLEYQQKHDKIKIRFCCKNDIPLLVIPYQYYNDLENFLLSSDFWRIITKNFND